MQTEFRHIAILVPDQADCPGLDMPLGGIIVCGRRKPGGKPGAYPVQFAVSFFKNR